MDRRSFLSLVSLSLQQQFPVRPLSVEDELPIPDPNLPHERDPFDLTLCNQLPNVITAEEDRILRHILRITCSDYQMRDRAYDSIVCMWKKKWADAIASIPVPVGCLVRVQGTPPNMNGASSTTISSTFTTPPAVGHSIVVPVIGGVGGPVTITDNYGNTYEYAVAREAVSGISIVMYYCSKIVSTGPNFTVTVTGVNGFRSMTAIEYSVPLVWQDQTNYDGNGATASVNLGIYLPYNEIVLVGVCVTLASSFHNVDGSGWTIEFEDTVPNVTGEANSKILFDAAGTYPSISWALNGTHNFVCAIVAFKRGQ